MAIVYDYLKQWTLFHDVKGLLKNERQRYSAAGEYLIGYPYIDHQAGVSMYVHFFCDLPRLRPIKVTADLLGDHKHILVVRYDTLVECKFRLLTSAERNKLGLPDKPFHIDNYEEPDMEPIRAMKILDPLRAPGFPDDIQFLLIQPGKQPERVWGRLERRIEGLLFECTLINQPYQAFGVRAGDRLKVGIMLDKNQSIAISRIPFEDEDKT